MKKVFTKGMSMLLALIMLLGCFAGMNIEAFAAENSKKIDGVKYYYAIKDGSAIITAIDSGSKSTVKLPSKLGGKKVTTIEKYAAYGTDAAKTLTIPDSVTKIGAEAFYGFYALKTINIGKGLKTLEKDPFPISTITKITVSKDNPNFSTKDGSLYNKKKTKIVKYTVGKKATKFTLPKTVTIIGDGAFSYSEKLETVSMPNVKKIGAGAFAYSTKFKTSTIPSKVTSIGDWAYRDTAVKKVTVPKSVTSLGYESYSFCNKLTSVDLSATKLKTIKQGTFFYAQKLSTVKLPSTVTSIGDNALSSTAIKSIDLSKMTKLGEYSFSGCDNLTKVTLPSGLKKLPNGIFCACGSLATIKLPSSVTSLGEYSLSGTAIKSITISKKITSIGYGALSYCKNLTSVTLPSNMTKIPSSMFCGCTALKTIKIPSGVTKIDGWAFESCTALESIKLPSTLKTISDGAFYNCKSLQSITIPNSVTKVGSYCFQNCKKLKDVTLSTGMKRICSGCFYNTGIVNITIPENINKIEDEAFYDCSKLKTVTIMNAKAGISYYAFDWNENLTFKGAKGSTTQSFAEDYGYKFKEI